MKAKELRIGNFVKNTDITGTVNSMSRVYLDVRVNKNIITRKLLIKTVDPIPLTEAWLLKFGFERTRLALSIRFDKNEEQVFYVNNVFYYKSYKNINIKYVHQLQNLYFALTGKELEIKE